MPAIMKAAVPIFLILCCLSAAFCAGTHPSRQNPDPAAKRPRHVRAIPDIPILDLRDHTHHKLRSFKGKVTVLYITKAQCRDCPKIHPKLNQLTRKFPAPAVNFLALFLTDSIDSLHDLLRRYPLSYHSFILEKQYLPDFNIHQLPAHLIINTKWEIVFRLEGSHSDPVAQLEPIIHRSINP